MNSDELSQIVNNVAHRLASKDQPGYFDYVEMQDILEFHILDFIDQTTTDSKIVQIQQQAKQLQTKLMSKMQTTVDKLIEDIRTQHVAPPMLKQIIAEYHSASNKLMVDEAGYDIFDDFLIHLFQVDFEPSETKVRTADMVYLQPTPGRIILDIIHKLPFTNSDCFYDLGSGLGQVPILVSLLANVRTIGIEYEPTYVSYSKLCVQKLGGLDVEFRNQDVRESDFSDGTIFFMHTPFMGSILRQVLDSLCKLSKQHGVTLCTYGTCTSVIEQESWLHRINHHNGTSYDLAFFQV